MLSKKNKALTRTSFLLFLMTLMNNNIFSISSDLVKETCAKIFAQNFKQEEIHNVLMDLHKNVESYGLNEAYILNKLKACCYREMNKYKKSRFNINLRYLTYGTGFGLLGVAGTILCFKLREEDDKKIKEKKDRYHNQLFNEYGIEVEENHAFYRALLKVPWDIRSRQGEKWVDEQCKAYDKFLDNDCRPESSLKNAGATACFLGSLFICFPLAYGFIKESFNAQEDPLKKQNFNKLNFIKEAIDKFAKENFVKLT